MAISMLKKSQDYRERFNKTGVGGVVVFYKKTPQAWVNELRNPEHWIAGCTAIDENGNAWVAVGGDEIGGAKEWQRK